MFPAMTWLTEVLSNSQLFWAIALRCYNPVCLFKKVSFFFRNQCMQLVGHPALKDPQTPFSAAHAAAQRDRHKLAWITVKPPIYVCAFNNRRIVVASSVRGLPQAGKEH